MEILDDNVRVCRIDLVLLQFDHIWVLLSHKQLSSDVLILLLNQPIDVLRTSIANITDVQTLAEIT